jgi:hypothetical protein
MQSRRRLQDWPKAIVPDVGQVVSRWTAARAGAIGSLWPATPRWVGRYLDEMLNAHAHSIASKG